jgi:CO/xanthine dehydrogenase FAD-binding subunit
MKPFEYIQAQTLEETCTTLFKYGADAKILAGGTDLLIEFRRQNAKIPGAVIDISFLSELRTITNADDSIIIKPLATHNQIMHSDLVRNHASLLASASSTVGSPQIRNLGTVGGNVMNAATCADTIPPLIALGASVLLMSKHGTRKLALADLFVKPYKTKSQPDELLVEIQFPKLSANTTSSFIKLGRRNALSISRLSVAATLLRDQHGIITEARIVPGAALPVWRRITEAEKLLVGEKPSKELFALAGKKVSEVMISYTGRRWSTEYKEPVIAVLVRRALEQCL